MRRTGTYRRRAVRPLLSAAAVCALGAGLTPPASAESPAAPAAATEKAPAGSDRGMELARQTRPVAPGAELTSFERLEPDKWLRADALSVDLGGGTQADYLSSGKVSERRPVSELAEAHDPGPDRRTVAAFNADFFDIDETGAPLGPGTENGEPTHSPDPGNSEAVAIGPDAAGKVLDLYFEGKLTLPSGEEKLDGYNAANVPADGVALYNSRWGKADRALTVEARDEVAEVEVRGGRVVAVRDAPGDAPVPRGATVLLGRGVGAKKLAGLSRGDRVATEYHVRTAGGGPVPRTAVGGRGVLVADGVAQDWDGKPNNAAAPRTAVGFSRDGQTMHVLTVDGRQAASGGTTLTELARMMKKLGAYNALNLDGGGSSTLLARQPGQEHPQLENSPSDGEEREVPNGLALTAPAGSGHLKGFWVDTATDPDKAPTADPMPSGHPERVFPGLTRQLRADGYDETYGPADGRPSWRSSKPGVGEVSGAGVFTAARSGTAEVSARRGSADGARDLTVIGDLDRVAPTRERVGLADAEAEAEFGVVGFDAQGTSAPVEPADVALSYDTSLFEITEGEGEEHGVFTVRAKPGHEDASDTVTVEVQGVTAELAVTVGLRDQDVADFEDADDWTFDAARASGAAKATPDGHTGQGLRLTYDFTQSTATRAAYLSPPQPVRVGGQPQSFGVWIKGDGHGAWPSLELTDAAGASQVLRGDHVDWEGWRHLTLPVPEGAAYPLTVKRFYLAETRPGEQYKGDVVVDGLTAQTPPDVELPSAARPQDPLISTAADVEGRDWRFAVLSDAQFVAREPDGENAEQARRTLREVKAAAPDFVVVNGDFVDEGSPEDLAYAHRMLDEELGNEVKWYYVPGNHEVMGGEIDNFVEEFGPARRTFDHKGTRFVTLDTSSLTLRGGGYSQFTELRRQLDAAAKDPSVRSVAVIQHVPPRDPMPQAASQLTDRREAQLLEDWLSEFRERSGKGAAFVGGHVGAFDASRVDGVPYLVNGNSGKGPAARPEQGGFTGWSLLGVDRRAPGGDWISVQTRAHVDDLRLRAPERLAVGDAGEASATVVQGEGGSARKVPVDWPVSADWRGSRGVCVDKDARPGGPPARCTVGLDSATGELRGLRPGTVTLSVTVNGERAAQRLKVG